MFTKPIKCMAAATLLAAVIGIVASSKASALTLIYCLAPDGSVNVMSTTFTLGCRSGTLPPGSREIDEARARRIQAERDSQRVPPPDPPAIETGRNQAAEDSALWKEIENSARIADIRRYLEKFPDGMFAALAEQRIRELVSSKVNPVGAGGELEQQLAVLKRLRDGKLIDDREYETRKTDLLNRFLNVKPGVATVQPATKATAVDTAKLSNYKQIDFGRYHALVIGNDDYKHLPDLKTAGHDARTVAAALREDYGFAVTLITDAGWDDILDALDLYRETLTEPDNLLIYYAGHGWLDEEGGAGYWLPVDARENRRRDWIPNSTISTTLKALEAKHVMVVADSCYSGTLVRGLNVSDKTGDYIRRMAEKRARVVLTSGGLEPVADLGGSGHSPFAKAFLDVLAANDSVLDGNNLFGQLRRTVMLSADQTPEYSDARKAGHNGGDFLFVRTQ